MGGVIFKYKKIYTRRKFFSVFILIGRKRTRERESARKKCELDFGHHDHVTLSLSYQGIAAAVILLDNDKVLDTHPH